MNSDRIKDLLLEALDQPPDRRAEFVRRATYGDDKLAQRVLNLARAHEDAGAFLADPEVPALRAPESRPANDGPFDQVGAIPGYRLRSVLGEGGFGTVYLARQEEPVNRDVAIKVVKPGMDSRAVVARFEAERQALAMMNHAGIAQVFDAGTTGRGLPYFVMEHVKGLPITTYCDRNRLSIRKRLELMCEVCLAVQHAHHKGIIHRDIKPTNVLVTEVDGRSQIKIIDFGIAKAVEGSLGGVENVTMTAQLIGTPQYMSPEQASAGQLDIDTRTDVYSLGVLLYELVAGAPPFDQARLKGIRHSEFERMIREEDPLRPSSRVTKISAASPDVFVNRSTSASQLQKNLTGDLDWIVMRALEKDRNRRYQTPAAMAADIRRSLQDERVEAGPPSRWYAFRKFARRRKPELFAAAVLGASILALAVFSLVYANEKEQARRETSTQLAKYQTVLDFTRQMIESVDPAIARGRDTALLMSILDSAAERATKELADQPEVAYEIHSMIGRSYMSLAAFDPAEAQFRKGVGVAQQAFGPADVRTITMLTDLGELLGRASRYEDAVAVTESVSQQATTHLGADHPKTLVARSNLGALYGAIGRWEDALEVQQDVHSRRNRLLGPTHEQTIISKNNLASALSSMGRDAEAIELLKVVLERQRETLGEEHPRTLATANNVAAAYLDLQDVERAEEMYESILVVKRKILEPGHPSLIATQNNLASLYLDTDRAEEAEALLNEALAAAIERVGPRDMSVLTLYSNLGRVYRKTGRIEEALANVIKLLEAIREVAGEDHPNTIVVTMNAAALYKDNGQLEEAEATGRRGLEAAERTMPAEHPQLATTRKAFAEILVDREKYAEAIVLLELACPVIESSFGKADQRTIDANELLAKTREHVGTRSAEVE